MGIISSTVQCPSTAAIPMVGFFVLLIFGNFIWQQRNIPTLPTMVETKIVATADISQEIIPVLIKEQDEATPVTMDIPSPYGPFIENDMLVNKIAKYIFEDGRSRYSGPFPDVHVPEGIVFLYYSSHLDAVSPASMEAELELVIEQTIPFFSIEYDIDPYLFVNDPITGYELAQIIVKELEDKTIIHIGYGNEYKIEGEEDSQPNLFINQWPGQELFILESYYQDINSVAHPFSAFSVPYSPFKYVSVELLDVIETDVFMIRLLQHEEHNEWVQSVVITDSETDEILVSVDSRGILDGSLDPICHQKLVEVAFSVLDLLDEEASSYISDCHE